MRTMLQLLPGLAHGDARRGRSTSLLAVLAFAVATGFALSLAGGVHAFTVRAAHPPTGISANDAEVYVVLAWVAVALLAVPIAALGGGAARLGLARRDARLAALRLIGATPFQVAFLALAETIAQALAGAIGGFALYGALLPVWTSLTFQNERLTWAEMWPGPAPAALTAVAVVAVAGLSAAASLRRVSITPLGVAARHRSKGLSALRLLALVAALIGWAIVSRGSMQSGYALIIAALAACLAAFNLVGAWLIWLLGRIMAALAQAPGTLLAARRLLDDPKGSWRVVGGPSLACFVATLLAAITSLDDAGAPGAGVVLRDLRTGALLTVVIAFAVAAASAAITHIASTLDRRREFALAHLAGISEKVLGQARRRQLFASLALTAGGASLTAAAVIAPLGALKALSSAPALAVTGGCIAAGMVLVLASGEGARPVLRAILAHPEPRPD